MEDLCSPTSELGVQCLPGNKFRRLEEVQTVGKPTVDIQSDTVIGDLAYGRLFDRDWVLFELIEEHFAETGGLNEETWLGVLTIDENRRVKEMLIDEAGTPTLGDLEGHSASREP